MLVDEEAARAASKLSLTIYRRRLSVKFHRSPRQLQAVRGWRKLSQLPVTVVGVGAVGRQAALQLASLGVERLRLVDFDRVELTNVTTRSYAHADVGRLKVEATADAVRAIDPTIAVEAVPDRFRARLELEGAVFCCVDSISAREVIWKVARKRCDFWVDGRMGGK